MTKTFHQESSEAFLNLKKSALRKTKKIHQRVLTDCFEKHFEKFCFSKKKLFGTLPPLLNKPMVFITKLLEKQFKDSPLQCTPNLSLQRLRAAVSLVHSHFFIEFSINFKRGRGQIVFSISQIT